MGTQITSAQYDFLVRPLAENRIQQLKGSSYLVAWDIRRHLIRVFGFDGFDIETKALDLVREIQHTHDKDGKEIPPHKPRWTVVYRAEVRLSIKVGGKVIAVFEDGASGDSCNQPSLGDAHDQAMKTALSQGLKRCAVNLGDQFGLGLYNGGRSDAVVQRSLVAPATVIVAAKVPDDAPVLPEPTQLEEAAGEPTAAATSPVSAPVPAASPTPGDDQATQTMMDDQRKRRMFALFGELRQTDRDVQLKFINWAVKRANPDAPDITHRDELTMSEADAVIRALLDRKAELAAAA